MKVFIVLLWMALTSTATAQSVLLPYRDGAYMGLRNEKGRTVVAPQFDKIHWQTGTYFATTRQVWVSDTVEYQPRHVYIINDSITHSGLIHQGREILKDEPFERFSVLPEKCIIAHAAVNSHSLTQKQFKKYGSHRRFKALFDTDGKNLHPENFRHLEFLDTSGTHPRYKGHARYVLLGYIDHEGREGLLVVDAYKKVISQWLLKNEKDIRVEEGRMKGNGVVLRIKQHNGSSYYALAKFNGKEYILSDMEVRDAVESISEVQVNITDAESMSLVMVPEPPMEYSPRANDRVALISYHQSGDSLMGFYSDGTRKLIQSIRGYQLLPLFARGSARGLPPLIFRSSEESYAIFDSLSVRSVDYDQLFYAGKYILAQKKGLWGLLDRYGEPIVPVLYDSLTSVPSIYLNYSTESRFPKIELRSDKPSQTYSEHAKTLKLPVLAFKKGEAMLLDAEGKKLLPDAYDFIAMNNLDFVQPSKTKFLIVRKSGKYGVIDLENVKKGRALKMVDTNWPYIPLSYFEDYYGIPGLKAFALYNDVFQLQQYVLLYPEKGRKE